MIGDLDNKGQIKIKQGQLKQALDLFQEAIRYLTNDSSLTNPYQIFNLNDIYGYWKKDPSNDMDQDKISELIKKATK